MAVDDDNGRFRRDFAETGGDFSIESAQSQWWDANWGIPSKGSICPSAPDRNGPSRSPSSQATVSNTLGTVNSAWVEPFGAIIVGDGRFQALPTPRVGSYGHNGWLSGITQIGVLFFDPSAFELESQLVTPSTTPAFGDSVSSAGLGLNFFASGPSAADLPAVNLATGDSSGSSLTLMGANITLHIRSGMATFTIPRHGSRPAVIPTKHPASQKLPGAINMAFYDGHVEQVKLERLWQLYWHKNYVPPAKRPGL